MKTKFKGTPGPWESYDITVYAKNGEDVACVYDGKDTTILDMDRKIAEANARLIAAAPELLGALQKTNDLLKDLNSRHTGNDRYRDFAIQYSDNLKLITKALEG